MGMPVAQHWESKIRLAYGRNDGDDHTSSITVDIGDLAAYNSSVQETLVRYAQTLARTSISPLLLPTQNTKHTFSVSFSSLSPAFRNASRGGKHALSGMKRLDERRGS